MPRIPFVASVLALLTLAELGCSGTATRGDTGSGSTGGGPASGNPGGGGSGSGSGQGGSTCGSVIGTSPVHDGTWSCDGDSGSFASCCTAAGGILGDLCNDVSCSVPGFCYPPPPPPTGSEFRCDFLNCAAGAVCVVETPYMDGCGSHTCAVPPAPCATTPTCACLTANDLLAQAQGAPTCTEDAAGNATVNGVMFSWAN